MKLKNLAVMALAFLSLLTLWSFTSKKNTTKIAPKSELAVFKMPTGGDFTIPSTSGVFDTKKQHGKVLFIFFGFTHCPHICPMTLSNIDRMIQTLPSHVRNKVQALFISIDPERDTLEVLQKRINYMVSKNNFFGATDNDKNLKKITQLFGARYSRLKNSAGEVFVDHTSQVFVVNSRGEWVNTLEFSVPPSEYRQAFETADDSKPVLSRIHPLRNTPLLDKNVTCDLATNATCTIEKDNKKIEVSLLPQPVKEGQEINVKVFSNHSEWTPILVDFDGVEQDMGYIRPALQPQSKNLYHTKFELPICELNDMRWNVRVILQNSKGETSAFGFFMRTKRE